MTTAHESSSGRCPLCGGRMVPAQTTTIPFLLEDTIAVIKDVPAEVCASCHEPYLTGEATDRVVELLRQLRSLQTEVSVVSYQALTVAA
jgi:YgiT-type zinc finger domain-containing protein